MFVHTYLINYIIFKRSLITQIRARAILPTTKQKYILYIDLFTNLCAGSPLGSFEGKPFFDYTFACFLTVFSICHALFYLSLAAAKHTGLRVQRASTLVEIDSIFISFRYIE